MNDSRDSGFTKDQLDSANGDVIPVFEGPPLWIIPKEPLSWQEIRRLQADIKSIIAAGGVVVSSPDMTVLQLIDGRWQLLAPREHPSPMEVPCPKCGKLTSHVTEHAHFDRDALSVVCKQCGVVDLEPPRSKPTIPCPKCGKPFSRMSEHVHFLKNMVVGMCDDCGPVDIERHVFDSIFAPKSDRES